MNTGSSDSDPDAISWKWLTGGWAIAVYVLIFLIVFFYVEEDWRGAMAWKQAQADIAATGESLDPAKFIPPPVPDDENFGLLPIFEMDTPSGMSTGMDQAFLRVSPYDIPYSKESDRGTGHIPYLGNWGKNEKSDLSYIQKRLTEMCHSYFPSITLPANAKPIELFGMLCPTLADLRAANPTHPFCRFDEDYTTQPPFNRPWGRIFSQMKLARILAYEERLALLSDQPQLALDDFKIVWKVDSGLRQDPSLFAGLISTGVVTTQREVICEGLVQHAWNDRQLVELDDDLGKIDYLREYQFCIRGDVAVFQVPSMDYLKEHRPQMRDVILGYKPGAARPPMTTELLISSFAAVIPDGWLDQYRATQVRFQLFEAIKEVDPLSRRVFPGKAEKVYELIDDSNRVDLSHNSLTYMHVASTSSLKQFACAQVLTDEARIACRLERYQLAHGMYPPSLDALTPAYGSELPRDIINGEAYHYKLNGDGTYLLYSVGWDEKDDGGKSIGPDYHAKLYAPDWVWPNHPDIAKTK